MTDRQAAEELLRSQHTLVLATVNQDGSPHNTPLFYIVGEGLRLYWLSSHKSPHSLNLKNGPVSVAIFQPASGWRAIRGAQMRGPAQAVRGLREKAEVLARYQREFALGPEFAAVIARSRLYVFEPAWVRYIDNSRGFGYRSEFSVE
jgi:hypothetical protein